MLKKFIQIFTFVNSCLAIFVANEPLFHESSKTIFTPSSTGEYFGYSVLLKQGNPLELVVGAPKAANAANTSRPGALYHCALGLLNESTNVRCVPHTFSKYEISYKYLVDDMWLGASLTDVSEDILLVCAPRWTTPYGSSHLLANGLCFLLFNDNILATVPLSAGSQQAFITDGKRKEYGEYGIHLNFYAYAQAGMSVKMSEDRTSLLLGAPGLLQWTGGVVQYQFLEGKGTKRSLSLRPVTNPYFVSDLHPDDYFGYSVETGVFDFSGETLSVAGAPRGAGGMGRVLIFRPAVAEDVPFTVMGSLEGPQLGAYFGSSLVCVDLNGDGRADVLVGAPNYAQLGKFSYDQGAVYVYLTKPKRSGFDLQAAGSVLGSGASGARFGSVIAALGDVDGDGYPEVAVGAPWEEGGRGAVYVYGAHAGGLRADHAQRISPSGARGFGIAISRGLDVDGNGCNDLAVGAHVSDETYLFRCVPSITVKASITVPGALEQPQNATNFTALFCVQVDIAPSWPNVKLELIAEISVDKHESRARLIGASEYIIQATPGLRSCDQRIVKISEHSDLSRPISLTYDLTPQTSATSQFASNRARLSDSSKTQSSFEIQLTNDCGKDLVCQPELIVQLENLGSSPFIPGSGERVGVTATILNNGEPAYGAILNVSLPAAPVRVPSSCEMFQGNMTCRAPSPLNRGDNATYIIELAYVQKDIKEEELDFTVEVIQPLNTANSTQTIQKLKVKVLPTANIIISGKALPNATLHVTRDQFSTGGLIKFEHYFEVTNTGPSNWPYLDAEFELADWASLSSDVWRCAVAARELNCSFNVPAHASLLIDLPFTFDLKTDGDKLEKNGVYVATTVLLLRQHNMKANVTTRLVLQEAPPLWPLAAGVVAGLLLLAAIIYACYKCGFFTRRRPQDTQETEHIIQEGTSRRGSVESLREPKSNAETAPGLHQEGHYD